MLSHNMSAYGKLKQSIDQGKVDDEDIENIIDEIKNERQTLPSFYTRKAKINHLWSRIFGCCIRKREKKFNLSLFG